MCKFNNCSHVCISSCTTVLHSTTQSSSDNFSSWPPDNCHSSGAVCKRGGGRLLLLNWCICGLVHVCWHNDYSTEAVRQVSDVANHINDHIKQQDNFMRMLAIQKSLACPVGPRILVPGRVFIKEGQLKKVWYIYLTSFECFYCYLRIKKCTHKICILPACDLGSNIFDVAGCRGGNICVLYCTEYIMRYWLNENFWLLLPDWVPQS